MYMYDTYIYMYVSPDTFASVYQQPPYIVTPPYPARLWLLPRSIWFCHGFLASACPGQDFIRTNVQRSRTLWLLPTTRGNFVWPFASHLSFILSPPGQRSTGPGSPTRILKKMSFPPSHKYRSAVHNALNQVNAHVWKASLLLKVSPEFLGLLPSRPILLDSAKQPSTCCDAAAVAVCSVREVQPGVAGTHEAEAERARTQKGMLVLLIFCPSLNLFETLLVRRYYLPRCCLHTNM